MEKIIAGKTISVNEEGLRLTSNNGTRKSEKD